MKTGALFKAKQLEIMLVRTEQSPSSSSLSAEREFVGKLLGFDDYVSKYTQAALPCMTDVNSGFDETDPNSLLFLRHGPGERHGVVRCQHARGSQRQSRATWNKG